MLQVTQNAKSGQLKVATVPTPMVRPGNVLIANQASIISAGTERASIELARKSLLGKAKERPDQVRRVLEKLRNEGLLSTINQVRDKLDQPLNLGYSSAGVVLECGAGVQGLAPGDRVASNGPHAGVVAVPQKLCAIVPPGVSLEQAAYAVLGSIALQGIRLSRVTVGETVLVIGLGLIGQIAVAILKASGCRIWGTDPDPWKCTRAVEMGAEAASPELSAREVGARSRGIGADVVLITASTKSNSPVELAIEAVRAQGRIVAVGAVGLELPRRDFYFKEAEFVVSRSYGPGRYDGKYEEGNQDYPVGYVRWTAQRNMQAVLDLMGAGRLDLSGITTHSFGIEKAEEAYLMIDREVEKYLGIVLRYEGDAASPTPRSIQLRAKSEKGSGIGFIGAGNYARSVLFPSLGKVKGVRLRTLCAMGGMVAQHSAEKHGFEIVTTDENAVFEDSEVKAVVIATRHDLHARQILKALSAGKHVFVEKPMALQEEEILEIEKVLSALAEPRILLVGFNRRFSPMARKVRKYFECCPDPLTVSIRFNAGTIPAEHWVQDEKVGGGRIVGESCHAIDLATFLTGSRPTRVFAECVAGPNAPVVTHDQAFITLRHANGSVSSIGYLAGGDKSYPKERVEVLGGGKLAIIEDFREVVTSENGKSKRERYWNQDKGHRTELEVFADLLNNGGTSPISWDDLRAVSLAAILAVRSIREGMAFDVP